MIDIDADALDEMLVDAVEAGALPGGAFVVADHDGVVYEGTAGRLRAGDARAPEVGPDTVFRMASMTKAMTTVAALQLVERGRLALDTPVREVLEEFGRLQVLDGWDGDVPRLRAPSRPPTVQDLMTHTSGLGYFFTNEELHRWQELTGTPSVLTGLRAGLMTPLVHDPGTCFEYGISTDWLGLVIEAIAGAPLDAVLEQELFEPLGMADATFRLTSEQRARTMGLHARGEDGDLEPTPLDLPPDPEFLGGGSGSYATAGDHIRFLRALLRGGELDGRRVMEAQTTALMFTDHIGGIRQPELMRSSVPELTNDVPSLPVAAGWGLGLHLRLERFPGMRAAGSADWAGLFNCFYWVDRESGLCAGLYTQVLPFFDHGVVGTLLAVEQALYAGVTAAA